jgi:hypothetical protein
MRRPAISNGLCWTPSPGKSFHTKLGEIIQPTSASLSGILNPNEFDLDFFKAQGPDPHCVRARPGLHYQQPFRGDSFSSHEAPQESRGFGFLGCISSSRRMTCKYRPAWTSSGSLSRGSASSLSAASWRPAKRERGSQSVKFQTLVSCASRELPSRAHLVVCDR